MASSEENGIQFKSFTSEEDEAFFRNCLSEIGQTFGESGVGQIFGESETDLPFEGEEKLTTLASSSSIGSSHFIFF